MTISADMIAALAQQLGGMLAGEHGTVEVSGYGAGEDEPEPRPKPAGQVQTPYGGTVDVHLMRRFGRKYRFYATESVHAGKVIYVVCDRDGAVVCDHGGHPVEAAKLFSGLWFSQGNTDFAARHGWMQGVEDITDVEVGG